MVCAMLEKGREMGKSGIWVDVRESWSKPEQKAKCILDVFLFGFCSGALRTSWLQSYRLFGFFWLGRTLAGQASKIQSDSQNAPRIAPAVDFAHP